MSKSVRSPRPPTRSQVSRTSKPGAEVDYVSIAIAYAEEAIEDTRRKWACLWIRLAAKRFIRDLKRAQRKNPPFYWSPKHANGHCRFIEGLPHVEGQWDQPTIVLEPWQIFMIVQLFGFRNLDGHRRYTEALLCIGRKNAKSTLAAAILLSVLCMEKEVGPQLISAATTGSQARIIWSVAKRMVELTPMLREEFDLEPYANAIARPEVGGTFKPINSKASTQDGLNPSGVGLDEIHAHKTHDLMNVLRSATGARVNPLWLYTTTEGYETPGPWPELRTFARQVLQRVYEADHFLCLIFSLDDDDEDHEFDPKRWIKANPLLATNPMLAEEIRKLAVNARAMPGTHAEFRIKRLNRPSSTAIGEINLSKWNRCNGDVPLVDLRGSPCWGGLDLASTMDMCAWRLLWLHEGLWYTWGRFWVPGEQVKQRTESKRVPYAAWVAQGWLTETEGDTADYRQIEKEIREDCERFGPQMIGYDSYNANEIIQRLGDTGVPLEMFIQGFKSYNPAFNAMELAYTSGRLRHGGDPVLRWNAANLVVERGQQNERKPVKRKSAEKIDGMVALLMAYGLAVKARPDTSAGFFANPVKA